MKKKIEDHRLTVFSAPYAVFTIICGCLGWMFSEYRILMLQIWYQVSAVIWLVLAVTAVVLMAYTNRVVKKVYNKSLRMTKNVSGKREREYGKE